jgi:hypothetical protein
LIDENPKWELPALQRSLLSATIPFSNPFANSSARSCYPMSPTYDGEERIEDSLNMVEGKLDETWA